MGKLVLCALLLASAPAFAGTHASALPKDLRTVVGRKLPSSPSEGSRPVFNEVMSVAPEAKLGGFSELVPYVLPAPDQDEAGSCLYMSLTGITEWWMARLYPQIPHVSDGPLDFSERYLMNLSASVDEPAMEDWHTDSIYLYNHVGHAVKNSAYRFTKGWWKTNDDDAYVAAKPGSPGAKYGVEYNWVDETKSIPASARVPLPRFKRDVLFADPDSDAWNTGVMPAGMVEKIKEALVKNRAPVHILYNHMGYWHANFIVGFDDDADNQNCKFVQEFFSYLKDTSTKMVDSVEEEGSHKEEKQKRKRAAKTYARLMKLWNKTGGCEKNGVFYVRDSIYGEPGQPDYNYDPEHPGNAGAKAPYSKPIVLLEYDWIRLMANHAVQILVE